MVSKATKTIGASFSPSFLAAFSLLGLTLSSCGSSGGGGGSGASASGSGNTNVGCPPESIAQIESEMLAQLSALSTEVDFSFYLEGADGATFAYDRGSSTMETLYASASTSKWITATLILTLVDQGYLSLADRPQDYIAGWPIDPSDPLYNITLAHLLSFTSGLVDEPLCLFVGGADFADCVNAIGAANANNGKVPGSEFFYAGTHLQVAGMMAIAARGAADWQEIFAEFQSQTGLFANSAYDIPSGANPLLAGGMHWTGHDYVDFIRALRDGKLLSEWLRQEMFTDQIAGASIGYSPVLVGIGQDWHYGFGNWQQCPSVPFDCGGNVDMVSSPGAYGAYPFLNRKENYFGILAQENKQTGSFSKGYAIFQAIEGQVAAWGDCH